MGSAAEFSGRNGLVKGDSIFFVDPGCAGVSSAFASMETAFILTFKSEDVDGVDGSAAEICAGDS